MTALPQNGKNGYVFGADADVNYLLVLGSTYETDLS